MKQLFFLRHIALIVIFISFATLLRASDVNPYIERVYEYLPGVGQFTNELPQATADDTPQSMAAKVQMRLANHAGQTVSLGGWGGYVVFGFDHDIVNMPDAYDLKICGNAFYASGINTRTDVLWGSSEPGIVMVAADDNGNGLPDDTWYELAGSDYFSESTIHQYTKTYRRDGDTIRNMWHNHPFYPVWLTDDSYTITGTALAANVEKGEGNNWKFYQYDWGYVDNHPNTLDSIPERHVSEFDIDWAVDEQGQHVHLSAIRFVKVYTAVDFVPDWNWTGEISTEVTDAWDLHPDAASTSVEDVWRDNESSVPAGPESSKVYKVLHNGELLIIRNARTYSIHGIMKQ